jgi:hypothetical protein
MYIQQIMINTATLKHTNKGRIISHACNHSTLGSRDKWDRGLTPAWAKKQDPMAKNKLDDMKHL